VVVERLTHDTIRAMRWMSGLPAPELGEGPDRELAGVVAGVELSARP